MKESYRKWSEDLFFERPDRPLYHGNGTISFITNCDHIVKGIAVLLYPGSKIPCVFCANCGGWIATLKQWQEWDQEHREIYKDPFRHKIQLTFSTSDRCLRSFWDLDPNEFQFVEITFLDPPIKKARGLFRNLGKKITQAMIESEERDEQHIWNELKEKEFKSMNILTPPFTSNDGMKGAPTYDFDFSTIVEISDLLLEEGDKK